MAYIPTEWETGDVITAEKLNNIEDGIVANEEAIADAFIAPEVTAADQGMVLTVDSSGEWDAANLPADKDVLVLEGTFVVDATLAPQSFTITSGDITKIDEYKTAYIKVTISLPGDTTYMYGFVPYTKHVIFDPLTMESIDHRAFELTFLNSVSTGSLSLGYLMLNYNAQNETWTYVFRLYSVQTN